jgi:hypothetical protein
MPSPIVLEASRLFIAEFLLFQSTRMDDQRPIKRIAAANSRIGPDITMVIAKLLLEPGTLLLEAK